VRGALLHSMRDSRWSRRWLLFLLRLGFAAGAAVGLATPLQGVGEKLTQNSIEDITVTGGKGEGPPHLVFACDGSASDIGKMLSQPVVISDLKELKAGIAGGRLRPVLRRPRRTRIASCLLLLSRQAARRLYDLGPDDSMKDIDVHGKQVKLLMKSKC
jgi:hypothetical protein